MKQSTGLIVKSWVGTAKWRCRCARVLITFLTTILLCSATHGGIPIYMLASALAVFGAAAEDSAERLSAEEETREASPRLTRLRISAPRDRNVVQDGSPATGDLRRRCTTHQQASSLLRTDAQGAGVRILC